MKKILVAGHYSREELRRLSEVAELYWLSELDESQLRSALPTIDCLFVHFWPKDLDAAKLRMMTNLSFVQSGLAGVNHILFKELPPDVVVSSNAGGYSDEVAEFAWALLLAGAKGVVSSHMRAGESGYGTSPLELGKKIVVLRGKVLGILGYGGIGSAAARMATGFGMKVVVLSRRSVAQEGVESFTGKGGLDTILTQSDAVIVALPLNKSTKGMIGKEELAMMKEKAVLVNVSRGEIIDQEAIYDHLRNHEDFVYATDVWWMKDGKERYPPELPFFRLRNFVGTPHVAGPSAVASGGPLVNAIDNVIRFARGEAVRNVVDRTDYV